MATQWPRYTGEFFLTILTFLFLLFLMQKKPYPNRRRRRQYSHTASVDKATIVFEGRVIETFPGPSFNVEVERKNDLPPIIIKANLKSMLIKRKVLIIKGDIVLVEVNIDDMATEDKVIKGSIVQRK